MNKIKAIILVTAIVLLFTACDIMGAKAPVYDPPTFEQFVEWEVVATDNGSYFVERDILMPSMEDVRAYYDVTYGSMTASGSSRSTVAIVPATGLRDVWSSAEALNLTFCIDRAGFGSHYERVKLAMLEACANWEEYANIEFKYVPSQDNNAYDGNPNVAFTVRPYDTWDYANTEEGVPAYAFFPSTPKTQRVIHIANHAFTTNFMTDVPFVDNNEMYSCLVWLLTHELGHPLGLAHEHNWMAIGNGQYARNWVNDSVALLTADPDHLSVMGIPDVKIDPEDREWWANGRVSRGDALGIQALYGANTLRYGTFFRTTPSGSTQKEFSRTVLHDIAAFQDIFRRMTDGVLESPCKASSLNAIVHNGERKYSCIFTRESSGGTWPSVFYGNLTRQEFDSLNDELYPQGFRIGTMDSFVYNGVQMYAVIFEKSAADVWDAPDEIVLFDIPVQLVNIYHEDYRAVGYGIKNLCVNNLGYATMVFGSTSQPDEEVLVYGYSYPDFVGYVRTAASMGHKLQAVDSYADASGVLRFAGVFTPGAQARWTLSWEIKDLQSLIKEINGTQQIAQMTVY